MHYLHFGTLSWLPGSFLLHVKYSLSYRIVKETTNYFVSKGGKVFCAFLDASKAFDKVFHCEVLVKLLKKNISLSFVQILRNWYRKLNASVLWNGIYGRIFFNFMWCEARRLLTRSDYQLLLDNKPVQWYVRVKYLGIYLLAGKTVKIELTITKGKYYGCYKLRLSVGSKEMRLSLCI